MHTTAAAPHAPRVSVDRWPSEAALYVLTLMVALGIWLLMAVSIVGILYAVFIGLFFFLAHMAFVAHVRGSAVKVTERQFPELHRRVARIARQMEMGDPPDTYIMQSGGALNALATRFLTSHLVVLYSDLLEACGDDHDARDMIIAHELAHVKCGHLRFHWLLLPGLVTPFPGKALSRAREFTCDRYGHAVAGKGEGALRGLAILAAGPVYGPRIDLAEFVRQQEDVSTGLMTLGRWFSTHPPLSRRIAALDEGLARHGAISRWGAVRALAIVGLLFAGFVGGTVYLATLVPETAVEEGEEAAEAVETLDAPEAAETSSAEDDAGGAP